MISHAFFLVFQDLDFDSGNNILHSISKLVSHCGEIVSQVLTVLLMLSKLSSRKVSKLQVGFTTCHIFIQYLIP